MSDINKFTTKEVLNKVLLDSSGNSVAANSHTSQEALNAVLDTSNNRLNVSLGGSNTISGDVTITGDLTVQGGGSLAFDEIIEGSLKVKRASAGSITVPAVSDDLVIENNDNAGISILTPDDKMGTVGFGSPSDPIAGMVRYDETNKTMIFGTVEGTDAGNIKLITANEVTAMTINSSQNATFSGSILSSDKGTITNASGEFSVFATSSNILKLGAGGSDNHLIIDTSGSVGIGTGSDTIDSPLHVKGGTANTVKFQSTSGATNIQLTDSSDSLVGQIEFSASGSQIVTRTSSTLSLGSNNVQTLHITDDDRVGIGISSPDSAPKLHIHKASAGIIDSNSNAVLTLENDGTNILQFLSPSDQIAQVRFGDTSDDGAGFVSYNHSGDTMSFGAGGPTRFKLDANSRISLSNNDAGSGNTVFGYLAGQSIDAGSDNNVFIGERVADASLNDATNNIGLGYFALSSLVNGDNNVVIGSSAGLNITGTSATVLIGKEAGNAINNASAVGSIGIGQQAIKDVTNGAGNTAMGYTAGKNLTDGGNNTILGFMAMSASGTSASQCTAVGSNALLNATGSNNTAVGYNAGDVTEAATLSTFVGYAADGSGANINNETVIGANATGQGGNSVTLGNADVTDVYMAQDKGAKIHALSAEFNAGHTAGASVKFIADAASSNVLIDSSDTNSATFLMHDSGGTETIRMNSHGGSITCDGFTCSSVLSTPGILFPDSQSASADANMLDDYEEGTYTPVVSNGSSNYSASTASGHYTKIGNKIFVQVYIVSSEAGSGGTLQVTLPFNYNAGGNAYITATPRFSGLDLGSDCVQLMLGNSSSGTSNLLFFQEQKDDAAHSNLSASAYSSGDSILFNVHYQSA